jgi:hypothetical protein
MTAVSILSGKSEEELEQCIQKGIPIFSQDKFDIKENPATFSQNLRRAVSELIMHDIDFEVRDTGRSIKEGYMYRMEQSD